jgi:hypothetical protein
MRGTKVYSVILAGLAAFSLVALSVTPVMAGSVLEFTSPASAVGFSAQT